MTTVTDSEIQKIEELIINFQQQIKTQQKQINIHLSDVDKKSIETDNKLIDLSCSLHKTSNKLEGNNAKIETNKAKIEALNKRIIDSFFKVKKRLTTQEFILRTLISAIIITITTIAMTTLINYIWTFPPI